MSHFMRELFHHFFYLLYWENDVIAMFERKKVPVTDNQGCLLPSTENTGNHARWLKSIELKTLKEIWVLDGHVFVTITSPPLWFDQGSSISIMISSEV